ncbi:MAG: ATP-binding protein, partial [Pseudomonadota bacterium]
NAFLETGGVAPSNAAEGDPRYVKPKNFWTRFLKWRLASSLPVYQDRNDISGLSYPEVRKSIKNGETYSMLLMSGSGNQVVAISSPVVSAGDVKGVLMLSTQPGEIGEILSGERLRIGLLAIIAGLATIIASILLARTVAGPMRRLSDAAEAVTADMTASQALPTFPGREDEVAQVARSFENMTSAMRRRIEASERFAADVAHELKNPLTAARTTAESLVYARTEEQRDGLVTQIGEELRRLDRLISDVSNIQRLDAELALQETEPVNLAELINGVTMTMSDVMKGRGSDVELAFENRAVSDDVTVRGHPGRIGQVLTNLIDNAVSFAPAGSRVTIELADDGDHCIIVVRDQGPGIDPDSLDRIFRRFYTYRPSGET